MDEEQKYLCSYMDMNPVQVWVIVVSLIGRDHQVHVDLDETQSIVFFKSPKSPIPKLVSRHQMKNRN